MNNHSEISTHKIDNNTQDQKNKNKDREKHITNDTMITGLPSQIPLSKANKN